MNFLLRFDARPLGWAVAGLMLLLSPAARAQSPVNPRIEAFIAVTKAIDNHAHPNRALTVGEEDPDWDQIPSPVDDFTLPVRLRPDNPEIINAWKALYGYAHDDMSDAHVAGILTKKQQVRQAQGDNFPVWVLDQIGTEMMLANRVTLGRGLTGPRFRWVAFTDALAMPLDNSSVAALTPDRTAYYGDITRLAQRYLAARNLPTLPATLDDYLRLMVTPTLEADKTAGAVAIKFEAAYLRSLDFTNPPQAEAAAIYASHVRGGVPSPANYKVLQDFIYRYMAREAGRLKLAVHIHVGSGVGGYFSQKDANPMLLEPMFNDPALRATNFVMLHAAWPYTDQVATLLYKPNVYADFSAMTFLLYPEKLAGCLRTWLEFAPEKVLFGTDACSPGPGGNWEELAWMTAQTGRRALGLALTGMVSDGHVSEAQALTLARAVLRDNAAKLYGFDQRASLKP